MAALASTEPGVFVYSVVSNCYVMEHPNAYRESMFKTSQKTARATAKSLIRQIGNRGFRYDGGITR